jgi:TPR repeat protein
VKDRLERTQKAAEEGDFLAQCLLGLMYYNGNGVSRDYKEAEKWLRRAALCGYASAQFNLGLMYLNGDGVPPDTVQAYAWLELAGASGVDEARVLKDRLATKMTREQLREADKLTSKWFPKFTSDQG